VCTFYLLSNVGVIHVGIYISEARICQQNLPIRINYLLRIYRSAHIVRVLKHDRRRHEEEREQEHGHEKHRLSRAVAVLRD
jgi:hypothetical protein